MTIYRGHPVSKPLRQRLTDRVSKTEDGCWEWQGATNTNGYGVVMVLVHRLMYELLVGEIPQGMVLDHVGCDNPVCCNPEHMTISSVKDNIGRSETAPTAIHGRKSECSKGHPYDEENTYVYTDKAGYSHRLCRECRRAANYKRQLARARKRGGAGYVTSRETEGTP